MPTARKLPSGSWRCQVFSHYELIASKDGSVKKKRVYKSFTCEDISPRGKKKCEAEAAAWAAAKDFAASCCNMTFAEALDAYIQNRSSVLSPATVREYRRQRNCNYKSLLSKRLCDITQADVQAEVNLMAMDHSPKTVRNMHGLISAVLNAYRPDFKLHTDLPKKVRSKIYVPSDAEIKRIIEYTKETDPFMETAIYLAAFGPMRRGEICALTSDNILDNNVHVTSSMVLGLDNRWIIKAPKSYAGDRYIMFPEFVMENLRQRNGRIVPLNPTMITGRFETILKKCGINHFRFHDLRHYSASIQHALGIPDAYIMQRGGWGNDAVLKNVYRHVLEAQALEMNQTANSYFENLCNTKCNTKKENP